MSDSERDDWLEEMLQREDAYIDDKGFTERIMTTLPPVRVSRKLRTPILAASTLIACFVGLVVFPNGAHLFTAINNVAATVSLTPVAMSAPFAAILAVTTAVSSAAAATVLAMARE